jgi:hypothetical protein
MQNHPQWKSQRKRSFLIVFLPTPELNTDYKMNSFKIVVNCPMRLSTIQQTLMGRVVGHKE